MHAIINPLCVIQRQFDLPVRDVEAGHVVGGVAEEVEVDGAGVARYPGQGLVHRGPRHHQAAGKGRREDISNEILFKPYFYIGYNKIAIMSIHQAAGKAMREDISNEPILKPYCYLRYNKIAIVSIPKAGGKGRREDMSYELILNAFKTLLLSGV